MSNVIKLQLVIVLTCTSFVSYAQDQLKKQVYSTVKQLFIAMETNDSTLAASLFTEDAMLFTVYENEAGMTQLRSSPANKLAAAFASKKSVTWHEPIWNESINIADGLASVWVDYAFYIGDTFSHCGVDAFHLVYKEDQWKIFHLADTRRKKDCIIPEEIREKYEK